MIAIRRAAESDADALAELGRSTFSETFAKDNRPEDMERYLSSTFGPELQRRELRDPKRRIAIAWDGSEAVGYFHLAESEPDPSVAGPKPIELVRLYVDARRLGLGVGAALMRECVALARREGFETLWLGVWEKNLRAQAFYRKNAFTRVGEHVFRLGSDDQLDYVMARAL